MAVKVVMKPNAFSSFPPPPLVSVEQQQDYILLFKTTPLHSLSTHGFCMRLIALALHLVSWSKRTLRAARSLWMKPLCERKFMAAATS